MKVSYNSVFFQLELLCHTIYEVNTKELRKINERKDVLSVEKAAEK